MLEQCGIDSGRLPIGGRSDDRPLQSFNIPARIDELAGKPIQERGMAWPVAPRTKIVARLDDAGAKILLPIAIDRHPRDQRIAGINEPLG